MACWTDSSPTALDARCVLGHASAPGTPDANGGGAPHGVVTVTGTDERVGDLVQDGVLNLRLGVERGQVPRKADLLPGGSADAGSPLCRVEHDRPVVQAVLAHQRQRE